MIVLWTGSHWTFTGARRNAGAATRASAGLPRHADPVPALRHCSATHLQLRSAPLCPAALPTVQTTQRNTPPTHTYSKMSNPATDPRTPTTSLSTEAAAPVTHFVSSAPKADYSVEELVKGAPGVSTRGLNLESRRGQSH